MDGLTIFWTQTAKKQRDYVFDYWTHRNKSTQYAKKLNLEIRKRMEILKTFPDIGKPTDFPNTRAIILGHYSLLYQLQHPKIIITGFWDNRQSPQKLLDFLKKE